MRAALCKTLDGPEALVIEELADPVPGPGEAVVRVRAAALNFFDTLITRGKYQQKPPLPFSPCGEIAGIVESIGARVTGVAPGDRVMAYLGWGGAREKIVIAADRLILIPAGVADEIAAGLSITYGTAIHGLRERGRLKPGEAVAVLGAAGGAGRAAVEIARLMGARVIAVASSSEKLEVARAAGADALVDYTQHDLKHELRHLTRGQGVDVIYDCVGGEATEQALRSLAWDGRLLVIGFAAGQIPRIPLNLLLLKGSAAIGVFWGESVQRDPDGHRANMGQVLDWAAAGKLKPRVHAIYPLDEIRSAMNVLEQRTAMGKVILAL